MDAPANSPRPTIRMACGAGIPSQRRKKTSNGPLGGGSLGFRVLMPVVYGRATAHKSRCSTRRAAKPANASGDAAWKLQCSFLLSPCLWRRPPITQLHTINSVAKGSSFIGINGRNSVLFCGPVFCGPVYALKISTQDSCLRTLFTVKIFPEKYEYEDFEKHGPANATHTRPLTHTYLPSGRPARTPGAFLTRGLRLYHTVYQRTSIDNRGRRDTSSDTLEARAIIPSGLGSIHAHSPRLSEPRCGWGVPG